MSDVKGLVKVAHGSRDLELRDVTLRAPQEGEVVIRVRYAGICGTDLHILADEFPSWPPVVLGHEFTGLVETIGDGVDPRVLGARVVSEPHALACHTCYLCRRGHLELCSSKRSPGWGMDGAFASHVVVPAWLLHQVPDTLPDLVAVLAEPMAVTMTALRRAHLAAGDHVLVIGPGPVGLLAALAARASGAADVVVAGRRLAGRLAIAARLGFAVTTTAEVEELVRERTDGRGADLVVETTGSAAGVKVAIHALRRYGRLAAIGLSGEEVVAVPWDFATTQALDVAFSMSSNYEAWDAGLAILGRIIAEAKELPTVFALAEWPAAFDAVAARTVLKAVLDPTELETSAR
jgi:L-iditol 2-dehydrogenase